MDTLPKKKPKNQIKLDKPKDQYIVMFATSKPKLANSLENSKYFKKHYVSVNNAPSTRKELIDTLGFNYAEKYVIFDDLPEGMLKSYKGNVSWNNMFDTMVLQSEISPLDIIFVTDRPKDDDVVQHLYSLGCNNIVRIRDYLVTESDGSQGFDLSIVWQLVNHPE